MTVALRCTLEDAKAGWGSKSSMQSNFCPCPIIAKGGYLSKVGQRCSSWEREMEQFGSAKHVTSLYLSLLRMLLSWTWTYWLVWRKHFEAACAVSSLTSFPPSWLGSVIQRLSFAPLAHHLKGNQISTMNLDQYYSRAPFRLSSNIWPRPHPLRANTKHKVNTKLTL